MNDEYYNNKFIESLIYDTNLEQKLKNNKLDDKLNRDFLINLTYYLDLNQQYHFLDKQTKEKIYELINYIRFYIPQTKETIEIINEIIRKTNRIQNMMSLQFYYNEANKRIYSGTNIKLDERIQQIFYIIDKIKKSISYDYQVLCDITKSSEEYKKIFTKYISDVWFLCSIKAIYAEKRIIFEDVLVRDNIEKVIMQNEKSIVQKELIDQCNEIKIKILKR